VLDLNSAPFGVPLPDLVLLCVRLQVIDVGGIALAAFDRELSRRLPFQVERSEVVTLMRSRIDRGLQIVSSTTSFQGTFPPNIDPAGCPLALRQ
jgi:hypothetical protein